MTMRVVVDNGPGKKRRSASGRSLKSTRQQIVLRAAVAADAPALHALIVAHLEEGRLLPRRLDELTVHASRFVVAVAGDQIVGCAERNCPPSSPALRGSPLARARIIERRVRSASAWKVRSSVASRCIAD